MILWFPSFRQMPRHLRTWAIVDMPVLIMGKLHVKNDAGEIVG